MDKVGQQGMVWTKWGNREWYRHSGATGNGMDKVGQLGMVWTKWGNRE